MNLYSRFFFMGVFLFFVFVAAFMVAGAHPHSSTWTGITFVTWVVATTMVIRLFF